ncbi:MAG: hypothetical protein IJ829_02140, partial [Kiritimatiellae bacterium]|nr:hypothetical protein [Kiritimatiellia bacterium]
MKFIRLALAAILSFSLSAYADGDEPSGEGASESSTLPRPDPEVAEFARGVKFTVEGYEGGTEVQKNFPVLVRLAEYDETTQAGIKGFRYDDFYNDGSADTDGDGVPNLETIDICFLDAETNAIPYDIDTWDTSGESLVWVNLPKMTNGTEFVMWYRSSKTGKFLNPTNAWTEYAGVWHFNEYYGDETGSVKVYDSTTNNLTGDTRYSAYTKGSSYEAGMIGRARKMGDNIGSDNKDTGGVRVPLGASDSVARKAVDALTPEFSASFWYRQENGRYEYLIGRKATDNTQSWGIQHNADQNNIMKNIRIWSSGNNVRAEVSGIHPSGVTAAFNTWYKLDVVWTADSKYQVYVNGVNTKNGDLNPKSVAVNGDVDLYLGGGGSGCRVLCGEMDEVRLRYGKPTAARVKADYQTVTKADFLTAGEVKTVAVVERPVVSFSITDYGASYVQFAGTLSSLGDANATSCTARYKIWRASGEEQPAEWATFASELGANATFSGIVKTLSPETVYSYKLEVVNDEDVESDVTSGTLTTSGAAVYGTGGTITRVGDDWLHTFRLTTVTNQYEFVAPSYATSVKVLAVAGGGPGGYRAGGGGGA